jgi:hypothetical protein
MANEVVIYEGVKVVVASNAQIKPHVAGALALCFANYPKEQVPAETVMMYDAALSHFDTELLKAATIEALYRKPFFPRPAELADVARKIETLITSKGMYLKDDASRKRIAEIRAWQQDVHPATLAFIAMRKEIKHR